MKVCGKTPKIEIRHTRVDLNISIFNYLSYRKPQEIIGLILAVSPV